MAAADRTTFSWAVRGVLATAGPAVGFVTLELAEQSGWMPEEVRLAAAVSAAAAVSLAALVLDRARGLGRVLLTLGLIGPVAISPQALVASPATAFIVCSGGLALIGGAWLTPLADAAPPVVGAPGRDIALRWSTYVSIGVWVALLIADHHTDPAGVAAAVAGFAVTLGHALAWAVSARTVHPVRAHLVVATILLAIAAAIVLRDRPVGAPGVLASGAVLARWITPGLGGAWASVLEHPARLLVATFAALSLTGAALLALPAAASPGTSISLLDAAFTSVSAVCVTGLIVLDTPNAFSTVGHVMIVALIQVGGLGIMTFYTAALSALGRRLSLRHESAIAGALAIEDRSRMFNALRRVLVVTFTAEIAGALVLFLDFFLRHGDSVGQAAWRGVFTSISAFCNAGFALQSDSLIQYNRDPLVLHVVALLIVLGGLSPIVVTSLSSIARRRMVRLQVRLVLATTALLLAVGFIAIAAMEWSNTLEGMSFADRLHNAWFQSVTTRTAGFNSVDTTAQRPATNTLFIALMFIGGAPGGTAGGMKVTTFAVLVLAFISALRGRSEATMFGRRVGHASVYKAAAVMTLGLLTIVVALMAMQLTQALDMETALFEVVSALGTVGLSIGGTGMLDSVGKVIIIACMFAGRVGPLTLFLFLIEHGFRTPWAHPEEELDVG